MGPSSTFSSPPSLRRRTEQALAAHPAGLTWQALRDEVARRAVGGGGLPPEPEDVVRELGMLIVEGRVDERDGRFILLVGDRARRGWFRHDAAA